MTALRSSGWPSIVTAFTIWFAHFVLCETAAEIWPHQWLANALAWSFTAVALLGRAVHFVRVRARRADEGLSGWHCRYAPWEIAIATPAVLFSTLPSVLFLP